MPHPINQPTCPPAFADDLDSVLGRISRYGNPTLCRMPHGGWWCYMDIRVAGDGVNFEIKSDTCHKLPKAAALECESRLMSALRALSVT